MKRVAIVGSGLSGLSASVLLARKGYDVHTIERSSRHGGRTFSIKDPDTNDTLDNGQHLILDCYTETFKYLSYLSDKPDLLVEPELELAFAEKGRGITKLKIKERKNSALAVLEGLGRFTALSTFDKLNLIRAGKWLQNADEKRLAELSLLTVDNWLDKMKQPERCRKFFWHPLAIAIMNEKTALAAMLPLARALKIALFSKNGPAKIVTPLKGLSDIFVNPAIDYLRENSSVLYEQCRVTGVIFENNLATGVQVKKGEEIKADAVILTGNPADVQSIAPGILSEPGSIDYSPIITCNIWFKNKVEMPQRTGMVDTHFHWVFRKDQGFSGGSSDGYLSLVMSAAKDYVEHREVELFQIALNDLHYCFPSISKEKVKQYRVIKERRATISITPEMDANRPEVKTKIPNLFTAGDWTQTQLPATIEGAVSSGFKAAEEVAGYLGY